MPFDILADGSFPDIGPRFDLGLATRDGTSLMCKNRDGVLVPIQRMAYMLSIDKQKPFKESTELQEKQRLIQLGTTTSIDREFDQWVQNTQGDWSGGLGQRVYGQQGVTNQYFDGEGLLWPLNDYIPQKALAGPTLGLPGAFTSFGLNDLCGGFLNGAGHGYAYVDREGANFVCHFQSGDTDRSVVVGTAAGGFGLLAMTVGGGFIWLIENAYPVTTVMRIHQVGMVNGVLSPIHTDALGAAANYGGGAASAIVSASYASNKLYVAVAIQSTDSATLITWQNELFVLDYTVPGAPTGLATPVDFPKSATQSSGPAFKFVDLTWQGTALFVSVSDGFSSSILELISPFTTVTTQAILAGLPNAFMCSVGSQLFLIATSYGANSQVNRMDVFILSGGQLTEWGVVTTPVPLLDSVTSPVTFGSYAIWAVSYTLPGATTQTITVFAFDVVRTRLFRALSVTAPLWSGSDIFSHNEVAVFGTTTRTLSPGATFTAQWGIALFSGLISQSTETAREFYWGVQPLTPPPPFAGLLQLGVDLTSGLFDFTAATNKLFRQIVATFIDGLLPLSNLTQVVLKAWFDQDPGRLAAVPDISVVNVTPPNPVPAQVDLNLVANRIARKVIYNVQSLGGGLASGPSGAISYPSMGTAITSSGVNTLPLTAGAPAGSLVVVIASCSVNQIDSSSSFTDSKGNTWITDRAQWNGGIPGGIVIAHSILTTALVAGDVITFQGRLAGVIVNDNFLAFSAIQIVGLSTPAIVAQVDQTSGAVANSNHPQAGPLSIGLVPEAVIGAVGVQNIVPLTPDAGWTLVGGVSDPNQSLQPVAQTFNAGGVSNAGGTFAAAHAWVAVQVAFTDTAWVNAPKVMDVIVQAATGWVIDCVVDLSPNVQTNNKGQQDYAYTAQSPTDATALSYDHVAAYNFLRQLWREQGGECVIYLPNGDSYPSLLQLEEFESPKPIAEIGRSDMQPNWQVTCTLKIREDI